MAIVVPRERRNAIALAQSPPVHCIRQLANASERVRVGVAVAGVIPRNRYDLLCTMNTLSVFHNRRNRQWEIHHQALHDLPLCLAVIVSMFLRSMPRVTKYRRLDALGLQLLV